MKFNLQWLYNNEQHSCGFLFNEIFSYKAFVVGDPPREKKIAKLTRFPAGLYELIIKKVDTPLTLKHRIDYGSWFKYHIEVVGIEGFSSCYVHSGNDATHTDGCLLPNYDFNIAKKSNQGSMSGPATKDFYALVYPLLEKGERCFIEVKNEPN